MVLALCLACLAWIWLGGIPVWWMHPYKKKLKNLEPKTWYMTGTSREDLVERRDKLETLRDDVKSATLWRGFPDTFNARDDCLRDIDEQNDRISDMINELDVREKLDKISDLLDTDPVGYVWSAMDIETQGWASRQAVENALRVAVQRQLMPLIYKSDLAAINALRKYLVYQDQK